MAGVMTSQIGECRKEATRQPGTSRKARSAGHPHLAERRRAIVRHTFTLQYLLFLSDCPYRGVSDVIFQTSKSRLIRLTGSCWSCTSGALAPTLTCLASPGLDGRGRPSTWFLPVPRLFLLVYPAGFGAAVLFVVIGWDVVSLFVECDGAVVLAHVDFKLPGGAAPFPAVVAVAQAVELF